MSLRQENATCGDSVCDKTMSQLLCGLLTALVPIDIEGDIHGALAFTELAELGIVQMRAQRTGRVAKARLPYGDIVEQTFDQNYFGAVANLLPCIQAALASRQEAMGERRADAAAIEVDDALALLQRKHDALIESVCTASVNEAEPSQHIERMPLRIQISAQGSTRRVADAEFPEECRIMHSAPVEIAECLGTTIQLLLIERRGLLKHSAGISFRSNLRFETSQALAEG